MPKSAVIFDTGTESTTLVESQSDLPQPLDKGITLESGPPTSVLVAHEPDDFRHELISRLRGASYDVSSTDDSGETLRVLNKDQPDVLVLQQDLPGMDGAKLLETFHSFADKVRFIVLLLSEEEIPRELREQVKIDYVMRKPVTPDEVVARIARINRSKDTT